MRGLGFAPVYEAPLVQMATVALAGAVAIPAIAHLYNTLRRRTS